MPLYARAGRLSVKQSGDKKTDVPENPACFSHFLRLDRVVFLLQFNHARVLSGTDGDQLAQVFLLDFFHKELCLQEAFYQDVLSRTQISDGGFFMKPNVPT